jgi:hypothetical protein
MDEDNKKGGEEEVADPLCQMDDIINALQLLHYER